MGTSNFPLPFYTIKIHHSSYTIYNKSGDVNIKVIRSLQKLVQINILVKS